MLRRQVLIGLCLAGGGLLVASTGLLSRVGTPPMLFPPPPPPEVMYPKAPPMPAPVPQTVEELLSRFEALLREKAPETLASLRPGLGDARIDELERQHDFVLPHDLMALYRWRDGAPRQSHPDVFAGHWFVPLEEAVAAREVLRRQVESASPLQRQYFQAYIGHTLAWLGVIVDLAGDGYFFDPGRSEAEGSFFFNFKEDGQFVFFRAFRNFLAATLEGHETGVFRFGDRGAETVDYARARELRKRYGAENPR